MEQFEIEPEIKSSKKKSIILPVAIISIVVIAVIIVGILAVSVGVGVFFLASKNSAISGDSQYSCNGGNGCENGGECKIGNFCDCKYGYAGIACANEVESFVVSPDGDDNNEGSLQSPFKTIEKAKSEARSRDDTTKTCVIYLREGIYMIENTITFTELDSQVIWKAYQNEEVFIQGSVNLREKSTVQKVTAQDLIDRAGAGLKLYEAPLDFLSITAMMEENYRYNYPSPTINQIYTHTKNLKLARYPTNGYITTTSYVEDTDGNGKNRFTYYFDRTAHPRVEEWEQYAEIDTSINRRETKVSASGPGFQSHMVLYGYLGSNDWKDYYLTATKYHYNYFRTETEPIYKGNGRAEEGWIYDHNRFKIVNIFDALDSPLEYYINEDNMMAYFALENDDDDVYINVVNDLFSIGSTSSKVTNLEFHGITFRHSKKALFRLYNADGFKVQFCKFTGAGTSAIDSFADWKGIVTLTNSEFNGNTFEDNGSSGIYFGAYPVDNNGETIETSYIGDRLSLEEGNVVIKNNVFRDNQQFLKCYFPGVRISNSCGVTVEDNKFYNHPHEAIHIAGNKNIVRNNYIEDAVTETSDSGAIYGGRDITSDVLVEKNTIVNAKSSIDEEGVYAIYLDDMLGGIQLIDNEISDSGTGIFVAGGRKVLVKGNTVKNSHRGYLFDNRSFRCSDELRERYNFVDPKNPPFSTTYPYLQNADTDDFCIAKYEEWENNFSCGNQIHYEAYGSNTLENEIVSKEGVYSNNKESSTC